MTTGHSHIRALDAVSGKLLWEYDAHVRKITASPLQLTWGNKGLAYWNGRLILTTADGRVIALDSASGKPVWEQRDFELGEMRNINGPPRVFGGKVIVGHGGADLSPIRGYVTAYDGMTGHRLWRFHTVPGDLSKPPEDQAETIERATWKGATFGPDGIRKSGDGTAWNAFSYDPQLNLIYLGVGNGYPYSQKLRSPGGGDLFLASIVAPPISYTIGGRQYVTVLTGSGSQGGGLFATGNAAYRADYSLPRHVLTFALDGHDRLPSFISPPLVAADDPGPAPDPLAAKSGAMAFAVNGCVVCHGMNAVGGGAAPDLRWSPIITDADAFKSVVAGGALRANGMPPYPQIVTEELEAIRAYLRTRAKQPNDLGKPTVRMTGS